MRRVTVVTEYDGWPNGLKIHRDGRIFISDYKRGIMLRDPATGKITPLIETVRSESFLITDSGHGRILPAEMPVAGKPMFSHA
jgi:hypothetical protein